MAKYMAKYGKYMAKYGKSCQSSILSHLVAPQTAIFLRKPLRSGPAKQQSRCALGRQKGSWKIDRSSLSMEMLQTLQKISAKPIPTLPERTGNLPKRSKLCAITRPSA